MKSTLRFHPEGGVVECLYTEAFDLQKLGLLRITRATDIRFDDLTQEWQVHEANSDRTIFSNPSRADCIAWELQNLQPKSNS